VAGAEPDGVRVAVLLWRLLRIDGYIQQIILGVVIIAAIFLDRLRRQSV
jgi:ribose/xylose/arabinose/galactoside ABC-type transport system permease subunit